MRQIQPQPTSEVNIQMQAALGNKRFGTRADVCQMSSLLLKMIVVMHSFPGIAGVPGTGAQIDLDFSATQGTSACCWGVCSVLESTPRW